MFDQLTSHMPARETAARTAVNTRSVATGVLASESQGTAGGSFSRFAGSRPVGPELVHGDSLACPHRAVEARAAPHPP